MKCGRFRAAISCRDLNQDIFRRLLGILHEHIEVAVFVENTCVQKFVFKLESATRLVSF